MSVTIEIRDRQGGAISAAICPLTNQINVTLPDSQPFNVDPNDPDARAWLKKVFGSQLELLLERR